MAGKIQNADIKSEAELTGLGANKTQLLNTDKMYSPKTTNVLEVDLRKNNDSAVVNPAASNDSSQNYEPGSRWTNTATAETFICISNGVGAAVWKEFVNTDTAQALTNKTLTSPTINGGTITNAAIVTPSRADAKQDTFANLTTYALTATNGQFCFATDTKVMYQVVDGVLTELAGSAGISGVDILAVDTFDSSALGDYTQTGLSLSTINPLRGTVVARLIHQSAINQSFKKVIAVDRKFRGKNLTLSLNNRSSAFSSNLIMTIMDETNAVILSSNSIPTDRQQFIANTNSNTSITNIPALIMNGLAVGQTITGPGIPTNTVITALNGVTFTATISQAATATAAVTLNASGSSAARSFSFDIPANCSSISYLVTALPEANLPESYIDDVIIQLTTNIILTGMVAVPRRVSTKSYTPIFTGFGAVTNIECEFDEDGEYYNIRGKFTSGTPTAVEARISLPNSATSANGTLLPSITVFGEAYRDSTAAGNEFTILVDPSVAHFNFGVISGTNSLVKRLGTELTSPGNIVYFTARIPIAGAQATTNIASSFSQAALVQNADSAIRVDTANGTGSTNTRIRRFTNLIKNMGADVAYSDSAIFGSSFTAQSDGEYLITFTDEFNAADYLGISLNTTLPSTPIQAIPTSEVLAIGVTQTGSNPTTLSWSGPLVKGDVVRPHISGSVTGANPGRTKFTMVKMGSLSQINPQLNNKITIPTHQLRFEGASSRGSTDTVIVKFDTQTITQGDGFSILNTAANGTVITIQKAGRLNVVSSLQGAADRTMSITKNQTNLNTVVPSASEILATCGGGNAAYRSLSASVDVIVGDKIRIALDGVPSSALINNLTLTLQETSFPLAISNIWQQNGSGFDPDNVLLQQFDSAVIGDFTQTGLNLVITNPINGAKSAKLTHQAASTQSFKQSFQVAPKFRGKNLTLRHDIISTATSGNLTLTVKDETNSVVLVNASSVPTLSQSVVATVSNTSSILTGVSNSIINGLTLGMKVTGLNIQADSFITGLNAVAGTITISLPATGAGTSVRISGLPSIPKVSFDVPGNCGQLSYEFISLAESNSPETYIDGISINATQTALMNTAANISTTPPTVQRFLTGSGTYTKPENVSFIRVRMVGAGGGGGGNSNNGTNNNYTGATGGNTLFADMIAYGGAGGGTHYPGVPGSASLGSSAIGSIFPGGASSANTGYNATGSSGGQAGGSSMFGGGAAGGSNSGNGSSALANTGAGGGGAGGMSYSTYNYGAAGGAAGGGIDAIIKNPSKTYSYSVGAGGNGAGGNNTTGGNGGSGYIEITEYYNTTANIPLTTAQLVQQPDSYLRIVNFNSAAVGSTATRIASLTSGSIQQSIGSAIQYLDDSVNGARFIAQVEGLFNFNYSGNPSSGAVGTGFSLNSANLTTDFASLPASEKINLSYGPNNTTINNVSGSIYLKIGDVIRIHHQGATLGTDANFSTFSVSYAGSLKQLNVSNDSKITIPTHQLRFEGATVRGSVDTGIVKFDAQTITQGDAFDVLNSGSTGTVVTIKKSGKLSVNACLLGAAGMQITISKNQSVLTSTPTVNSEIMQSAYNNVQTRLAVTATFDVNIGDKIRLASTTAILGADPSNIMYFSLTENSIPANFSNVLPQWSQGDSLVRLNTANGNGSTNTFVRRMSNNPDNFGSAISYADSATLGSSFTINEDGEYKISYQEVFSGSAYFGISKNSVADITTLSPPNLIKIGVTPTANQPNTVSDIVYLVKGDVIRMTTDGTASNSAAPYRASFAISKVGKPNLSSVDVTPFVNMKTTDTEAIYAKTSISAVINGTAEAQFTLGGISTTNKGIISIQDDSANTRTKFVALKDCVANVSYTAIQGSVGQEAAIYKNGIVFQTSNSSPAGGNFVTVSASLPLVAGDFISLGAVAGSVASYYFSIIATADNNATASPTQQISSDTLSFAFKATAIDPNVDPIGTFNTYTYAANTNAPVIATTAPTQTTSSMNINGIQVFARAYNATSTSASPTKVDIFIGKGLKSKEVDAYANAAKTTSFFYLTRSIGNAGEELGTSVRYSETNGILTIDAGFAIHGANTIRILDDRTISATSGYFVFNASKSPSLVTIPNVTQRIAYLSDQKVSGTGGGSAIAGTQTRTLNTIVDSTGIVTSLASNQFTLPSGVYSLDGFAAAYTVNSHKARIRNITDATTVILGSSEQAGGATTGAVIKSHFQGEIIITSPKVFELQHFTQTAAATNGLGLSASSGENELYAQVKITKIK